MGNGRVRNFFLTCFLQELFADSSKGFGRANIKYSMRTNRNRTEVSMDDSGTKRRYPL